jgi:hypothetical protein
MHKAHAHLCCLLCEFAMMLAICEVAEMPSRHGAIITAIPVALSTLANRVRGGACSVPTAVVLRSSCPCSARLLVPSPTWCVATGWTPCAGHPRPPMASSRSGATATLMGAAARRIRGEVAAGTARCAFDEPASCVWPAEAF